MSILVTGANGFVGSWVSNFLSQNGHLIEALVRPTSDTSRIHASKNLKIVKLDSRDWAKYLRDMTPDSVILSDWAGVAAGEAQSELQIENVGRWSEIANAAKSVKTKNFIAFGSQAEIGTNLTDVSENPIFDPLTNYGLAKVRAFETLKDLFEDSNTRFIWARIYTVYGPRDNRNWLIPRAIDAFLSNRCFETTKGEQRWNYLYISDLCRAINAVLINPSISGVVNFANPHSVKIADLLKSIERLMGKQNLLKLGAIPYSANQIMNVSPRIEKLSQIGWAPECDLKSGLKLTIRSFSQI